MSTTSFMNCVKVLLECINIIMRKLTTRLVQSYKFINSHHCANSPAFLHDELSRWLQCFACWLGDVNLVCWNNESVGEILLAKSIILIWRCHIWQKLKQWPSFCGINFIFDKCHQELILSNMSRISQFFFGLLVFYAVININVYQKFKYV